MGEKKKKKMGMERGRSQKGNEPVSKEQKKEGTKKETNNDTATKTLGGRRREQKKIVR